MKRFTKWLCVCAVVTLCVVVGYSLLHRQPASAAGQVQVQGLVQDLINEGHESSQPIKQYINPEIAALEYKPLDLQIEKNIAPLRENFSSPNTSLNTSDKPVNYAESHYYSELTGPQELGEGDGFSIELALLDSADAILPLIRTLAKFNFHNVYTRNYLQDGKIHYGVYYGPWNMWEEVLKSKEELQTLLAQEDLIDWHANWQGNSEDFRIVSYAVPTVRQAAE